MRSLMVPCCWFVVIAMVYVPLTPSTVWADAGQDGRITTLQTQLNSLGYNAGVPDGIPGPRTDAAIRAFQRDIGFPADGKVTDQLVGAIYAAWLLQLNTQLKNLREMPGDVPAEPPEPESLH